MLQLNEAFGISPDVCFDPVNTEVVTLTELHLLLVRMYDTETGNSF